jgi:hypothetical protein
MKKNINTSANVITKNIKDVLTHKQAIVMNIDIEYPNISLKNGKIAQPRINLRFNNIAKRFYDYAVDTLLPGAIELYERSIKESYPFHAYDIVMKYNVTLNDKCTLSTYYDQYQYTGGAHGTTLRLSDTFSLQTGNVIKLEDLFENTRNYKEVIIKQIINQANENMLKNPGIYFDDYKKLIIENFSDDNFYITPKTLDIYYQQYDIAPYSTGIVVFSIPYKKLVIKSPQCTF